MANVSVVELMTRYGFVLETVEGEVRLENSNKENEQHLVEVVNNLRERGISLMGEMLEADFVEILERSFESTCESLFAPQELAIHTVDIYVRGLVMQLNRLGLATTFSCDGHDDRSAKIYFQQVETAKMAESLLNHVGLSSRRNRTCLTFSMKRQELPQFAGKLAKISKDEAVELWEKANPLMNKTDFNSLLDELLSIYGVSGKEEAVREFAIKWLKGNVDHLEVDHYGNVLAQKRFGNGPTVLLNAHLDTVSDFVKGRSILKDGSIWSSSEGVLGADDRAGVCVLLANAKYLQPSDFNGTLKFAFTVEEEIGLVGARQVAKSFLWDVDMAFVLDRRGTGDIVTSCGGVVPFCTDRFARQVERIAKHVHPNRWSAVAGGSSDTRIWAQQGINSINLSVGYQNEHTEDETLDVEAAYGTYELVAQLLEESRSLTRVQLERRNHNRATERRGASN